MCGCGCERERERGGGAKKTTAIIGPQCQHIAESCHALARCKMVRLNHLLVNIVPYQCHIQMSIDVPLYLLNNITYEQIQIHAQNEMLNN